MNKKYNSLLSGFYVCKPPQWLSDSLVEDFEVESDRRIMDITSQLWRYWPLGSQYALAKYGDEFALGVAAGFLSERASTCTVWESIRLSLLEWLDSRGDLLLDGIFRYESRMISKAGDYYDGPLKNRIIKLVNLPECFALEHYSFDVVSFVKLLGFYHTSHAPLYIWRKCLAIHKPLTLVSYTRNGKVYIQDVTEILEGMHTI